MSAAHQTAAPQPLRATPATGGRVAPERLRFLARYATMAPSSRNSQPWRIRLGPDRIDLLADQARWLPVADADRRELYLSLGCALENLLLAVDHYAYIPALALFPDGPAGARVASIGVTPGTRSSAEEGLFHAITSRQTNHLTYEDRLLEDETAETLAGVRCEAGVAVRVCRERDVRAAVAGLVRRADRTEFADPAFRRELGTWVGRGAFGTPPSLRRLARFAVTHLDTGRLTGRRDAARIMRSGGIIAVLVDQDDPASHVRAGRVVERIWLHATLLHVALQPMSAPLELPALRGEVGAAIGAGPRRVAHLFRAGYARVEEFTSPRRPLTDVLA